MIRLRRFEPWQNEAAVADYLRIKYRVFVREQSWSLPVDEQLCMAKPDPFDASSRFVLALADGSEAIGVVRATRLTDAIPHPELIGRVLQNPRFCLDIESCATANSLAVSLQHRGARQEIAGKTRPMTVGKALICEIADWLRGEGCQAILLTTARAVSAVFFEHLGFYVIETHVKVEGMGTDFVTMGCVLDDYCRFDQKRSPMIENCPPRPLADPVNACRDFMAEQHHRLLGGASIEVFVFGAAEPDACHPRRNSTPP